MKKIFLSCSLMLLVSAGVWPQENAFGGKYVNAFKADSVVWKCYWDFSEEKIKLEDPFDETVLHGDTVVSGKQWKNHLPRKSIERVDSLRKQSSHVQTVSRI